ncbi:hypothetical protein EVAR_36081_1 [Eumeta japonica]|uniref:Uncharacterized protein n=1 Tax=Eumeta variegata TaxID=151549 RepID=A0A4C1YFH3_EUMVA|nr:hypothetical protein EVAR_36081_1 [Eumeta japonica]
MQAKPWVQAERDLLTVAVTKCTKAVMNRGRPLKEFSETWTYLCKTWIKNKADNERCGLIFTANRIPAQKSIRRQKPHRTSPQDPHKQNGDSKAVVNNSVMITAQVSRDSFRAPPPSETRKWPFKLLPAAESY